MRLWSRLRGPAGAALWRMSRRRLLWSLAALGLALRPAVARDLSAPGLAATLHAFADTLVPPDENSPGAGELGVHREILGEAPGRTNYPDLLLEGVAWLDAEAGGAGFAASTESTRQRIVGAAFAAVPGSLPRVFAEFLRQDVMRLYYARPESWTGMIDGPPQPDGHLLAHLPPEPQR